MGDGPQLPVPSHGTTGSEGVAAHQGVVMGEVEEARGNLQSLRGKLQRWEPKLGRRQELGDISVGLAAGEKLLEGKRRLSEAQRAVEELEGKLASMGTRDNAVKVEEGGGGDNVQLVGVEGHPEGEPCGCGGGRGGGVRV